jgi:hypothetical protein
MGDERHKKSPPEGPMERVTPELVAEVRKRMVANRIHNQAHGREPGHPKYQIADHADLANVATGGDKTMVSKIIGPAKPGTKIKRVKESRYVAAIREAMGIPPPKIETIEVPADRAETLRRIARLPDDLFEAFETEVNKHPD